MPHATCIKLKLHYFPVPKNAGSSIRDCLFEIENGWRFRPMIIDGKRIGLYNLFGIPTPFRPAPETPGFVRIAVVRDPIRRLVSAYANRVLRHQGIAKADYASAGLRADLPKVPDIETFVAELDEYRKIGTVAHHTNPQAHFLGSDLGYFHHVFRVEALDELERFLGERAGMPVSLPRYKSDGPKIDPATLSAAARQRLAEHYAADYALLRDFYPTG
jgi:hypothetical protein